MVTGFEKKISRIRMSVGTFLLFFGNYSRKEECIYLSHERQTSKHRRHLALVFYSRIYVYAEPVSFRVEYSQISAPKLNRSALLPEITNLAVPRILLSPELPQAKMMKVLGSMVARSGSPA